VGGGERSVSSPSQPGLITQIDCPPAASRDHIALAQSVHPSLSEMVVGATLSNILGAFSLGLIFQRQSSTNIPLFDQSSTNYTVALLIVTCLASGRLTFGHPINWRAVGGGLVGLFVIYIATVSVSYLIAKGFTTAPEELSDSESGSDGSVDDGINPLEDDHEERDETNEVERATFDQYYPQAGSRRQGYARRGPEGTDERGSRGSPPGGPDRSSG